MLGFYESRATVELATAGHQLKKHLNTFQRNLKECWCLDKRVNSLCVCVDMTWEEWVWLNRWTGPDSFNMPNHPHAVNLNLYWNSNYTCVFLRYSRFIQGMWSFTRSIAWSVKGIRSILYSSYNLQKYGKISHDRKNSERNVNCQRHQTIPIKNVSFIVNIVKIIVSVCHSSLKVKSVFYPNPTLTPRFT